MDERGVDGVEVHAVTADRLDDVADLFASNGTTRGCWCMYFIASRQDFGAGYRGGNREAFEQLAANSPVPFGLLAYRDGQPVGWCAIGPRSRYPRVIGPRAKILAKRDPAEDDDVWLVPCFFVRVGERGQGITSALLDAAVELAREHGATAVEGFPRSAGQPPSPDDFLGREAFRFVRLPARRYTDAQAYGDAKVARGMTGPTTRPTDPATEKDPQRDRHAQ